ncbi:hypothetical protein [Cereibacter changlensis]|nr:hypothetical protein [Cereibacter changlensis]
MPFLFRAGSSELLPGMFVRTRLARGVVPDALLLPEDAVLRH